MPTLSSLLQVPVIAASGPKTLNLVLSKRGSTIPWEKKLWVKPNPVQIDKHSCVHTR